MGPRRHHESFPLACKLIRFLNGLTVLFVACIVFVAGNSLRIDDSILLEIIDPMTLRLLTV